MSEQVSPKSQGSHRRDAEESYQPGYSEKSLSMGTLIHNCAMTLENECANLERGVELKTLAVLELKENLSRQAENIAKQQSEQEHLKVLAQREILNREIFIAK